jgi:choline dehydrogenase
MHRPNLTVMTHTLSEHLVFDGDRCIGMEGTCRGQPVSIRAQRVILAAGAIGTPALLERSGIGDEAVLAPLGIQVHTQLLGVGNNLQDHLQVRLQYRLKRGDTLNQQANSWFGRVKMALQYAYNQSGPLSMAPSQLGAFFKSSDDVDRPDLEFHIQPMSADQLGTKLHPFPGMTASVCQLRPTSRGSTHISGPRASDAPRIDPRYLSETHDQQVVCQAIEKTRALMDHPLLDQFSPSEHKPGRTQNTPDELIQAAGDVASTIFHPVGTAKMGPATDTMAVVSEKLEVHGVQHLYIADASVMPTITSGNTHAPTVMIAERLASWLSH